jgi:hypothetical protein
VVGVTVAYKFLARSARAPITGQAWPRPGSSQPGAWMLARGPLQLCREGVHACRTGELAYWLHEELWRVELDGEQIEGHDCLVAARGRLLERVDAWSEAGGAQRFAAAVRDHAESLILARRDRDRLQGYVDDASWHVRNGFAESPALAALCSAMAVAKAEPNAELEAAYRRERAWQSAWIVREMRLE